MQGDDVQSDDVRAGDRMRRARRSHARRAPFILAEAEGRLWHGEPEGKAAKQRRRSGQNWTGASADASGSVLQVASSARFCRRVRMQSNRPRANKLETDDVEAERERRPCEWLRKYAGSARTGAVRSRRVSSCVGRGCSTREQENPEVRGEVGIAN
jgi:hypothetical protein